MRESVPELRYIQEKTHYSKKKKKKKKFSKRERGRYFILKVQKRIVYFEKVTIAGL